MWAGISCRGVTAICIFEGIMDRFLFTDILLQTLVPFIQEVHPFGHRFMQDNDPKHTSLHARQFLDHNVNLWPTPPESPDANSIENLWHEMKVYIRREIKPRTIDELVEGVKQFWKTRHLWKVIPRMIEVNGDATRC